MKLNIKKINMNGTLYIGDLKISKDGKEFTLEDAMGIRGDLSRTTVAKYFKKKNIGELSDIKFGGKGTAYAISDLLPQEQMFVQMAEVVMDMAKEKALQTVENNVFDEFLGK